jgi:hypothetical protein
MREYSTSGGCCPRSLTLAKGLEPDHFPLPNQGLVGNESGGKRLAVVGQRSG